MRGGRRSASVLNRATLLHRLESYNKRHEFASLVDTVNYLRSNFRSYRGLKEKPFARIVQNSLNSLTSRTDHSHTNNNNKSPSKCRPLDADDDDGQNEYEDEDQSQKQELKDGDESRSRNKTAKMEEQMKFSSVTDPHASSFSSSRYASASDVDDDDDKSVSPYLMKPPEKNVELEIAEQKVPEKIAMVNITNNKLHRVEKRFGTRVGVEKGESSGGSVDGADGAWFKDFGGMKWILEDLTDDVINPIHYPELLKFMGETNPGIGILLHVPPGCGKTRLAHAIANEAGVPFYKVAATELVLGVSGASEENIRELFSKANMTAPSIVFIDEIDAIASKRENVQKGMERRIVTQLMTCMDDAHGYVFIIGATNKLNDLDPALRRPGRFDREISMPVPDENARVEILSVLTHDLKIERSFDIWEIARSTSGFVGADLVCLVKQARKIAFKKIMERKYEIFCNTVGEEDADKYLRQPWLLEDTDELNINMADFREAVKKVQSSLKRDGFSTIPDVKWEDVGGLHDLREQFVIGIVDAIKYREIYKWFGVKPKAGYMLYGPPGCGKTLLAKAVANETGANFIYVKGAELLNKYVGESELAVRTLFKRARTCAPCIIFFDEVDALATERGTEGSWVTDRLLNQLLVELDGEEDRQGVFVIGATNRLDVIDEALLRPGRFGPGIYVPPPSPDERGLILKAHARHHPIDASVDLTEIGKMRACDNLSGADLADLMLKAATQECASATQERERVDMKQWTIKATHFEKALGQIRPSISDEHKLLRFDEIADNGSQGSRSKTKTSNADRCKKKGKVSIRNILNDQMTQASKVIVEHTSGPSVHDCMEKLKYIGWGDSDPLYLATVSILCEGGNYRSAWMLVPKGGAEKWVHMMANKLNIMI